MSVKTMRPLGSPMKYVKLDQTPPNGPQSVTGQGPIFDVLRLNTAYTPTGSEALSTSYWDVDNKTISTILEDGVVGQRFEELFIIGQNDTGGTLSNGSVATYAGSIGNSGNIRIANTVASATEPPIMTLGIITADILDTGRGRITTTGKVRGIQTNGANYGETWVDGEIVYKSPTIAGGLTNVMPQAPIPAIPLAVVTAAHATNGTLLVRPTFPQKLVDLVDVNGTPLTITGQILYRDETRGVFDFTTDIRLGEGVKFPIKTVTEDYTMLVTDYTVLVDASSNSVEITLPDATLIEGQIYNIKCIDDTFTVTVSTGF